LRRSTRHGDELFGSTPRSLADSEEYRRALLRSSSPFSIPAEFEHHLKLAGFHPPEWAEDVPGQFAENHFNLVPRSCPAGIFPTTRNGQCVTKTNIHDELTTRGHARGHEIAARRPGSRELSLSGNSAPRFNRLAGQFV
jgi:hypothetical protein